MQRNRIAGGSLSNAPTRLVVAVLTALVALVAGGALVATGVTLWVLDGKRPEGAYVELRPGADGGSLVMAGRF